MELANSKTFDNLKTTFEGLNPPIYGYVSSGMARVAREEGFDEISDWFVTFAKVSPPTGRFTKTLRSMDD
ncbi:MAG: hypothetical protein V3U57_06510 [Robiginitomaculum sp.]